MSEIATAGVRLGIPIVGEFHRSRLVAGGGEKHVGVAAFLVRTAADLAQAEHLEEADGVLQRTDADHGVQIFSHGVVLRSACSRFPLRDPLMKSVPQSTSTAHVHGPRALS